MAIKKKTTIVIILLAVYFLLIFFVIRPVLNEIKENSNEIVALKGNIANLEEKAENLKKFKNLYQEYEPDLDKIDNLFISSEVPVEFIAFFESLTMKYELENKISLVSFKESEDKKETRPSLIFRINSKGSFLNFSRFLEKMEASPYLLEVQDFSISKTSRENEISGGTGESLEGEELLIEEISANFSVKVCAE